MCHVVCCFQIVTRKCPIQCKLYGGECLEKREMTVTEVFKCSPGNDGPGNGEPLPTLCFSDSGSVSPGSDGSLSCHTDAVEYTIFPRTICDFDALSPSHGTQLSNMI